MNNKKITSNVSEKDKILLCVLGSILVLALAYIFVFSPLQKKSDVLAEDNDGLRKYISVLDDMRQNEETKKAEIAEYNEKRDEMLSHFSKIITNENAIEIIDKIEKETTFFTSQNTIVLNDLVFNQEDSRTNGDVDIDTSEDEIVESKYKPEVNKELVQEYGDIITERSCITVAYSCTYQELVDTINYINAFSTKMNVDNVVIGFDSDSGNLKGTMDINIYSVDAGIDADKVPDYEGGDYKGINYGVSNNIFGSREGKSKKKK